MTGKQIEKRFNAFKTAVAILIALALAFIVIALISDTPVKAITTFITGPLQKKSRIGNVLEIMTPLLFTGTAISIMYQANVFNMVGEGAFLIAANLTTLFCRTYTGLSKLPMVLCCLLVGIFSGVMAAMIPAVLQIRFKANVLVSSLMMNYILLKLSDYIFLYHLKDTASGLQASRPLPERARLTNIISGTRVHSGFIIGLAVCIIGYLFIYRTKWGYAIRMVGANESFAKYSGISVVSVALATQLIGGGIAGLGGSAEVMGMYNRFIWFGSQPGYGFDGVLVGVLAGNNPLMVPFSAFFLAYLRAGADVMNRVTDVPIEFVDVIQGIIIILVAAEMFMAKFKHKLIVDNAKKQLEQEEKA